MDTTKAQSRKKPVVHKDQAPSGPALSSPTYPQPRPFNEKKINPFPAPFPVSPSQVGRTISTNFIKSRPNNLFDPSKPIIPSPPSPVESRLGQIRHKDGAKKGYPPFPRSQNNSQAALRNTPNHPATGANATPLPPSQPRRYVPVKTPQQLNRTLLQLAGYANDDPTSKEMSNTAGGTLDLSVWCKRCEAHHSRAIPCKNNSKIF